MIWNFFKRKNAQPVVDKEKGTSKYNSEDVSVDVDGKKVPIKELENAMMAKENEDAEAKKKAEEKEDEPLSVENSVTLSNGKEYNVGDLVENWKRRNMKKNGGTYWEVAEALKAGMSDKEAMSKFHYTEEDIKWVKEEMKKETEEKKNAYGYADVKVGQKVRALGGVEFKSEMTVSRITPDGDLYLKASDGKEIGPFDMPLAPNSKKNTSADTSIEQLAKNAEEELAKAEEAKKNAEAEAKKKAEEEEKEKKENAKKSGLASFKDIHNARNNFVPTETRGKCGASTREERAEAWKKKNGGKK